MIYLSLKENQDYSALKVIDFNSVSTLDAQYEQQLTITKSVENSTLSEKIRTDLLPESSSRSFKKWISLMLCKVEAFSLADVFFMLVELLEFLSQLKQKR